MSPPAPAPTRAPTRAWLARPVLEVAPDLLGAFVTTVVDAETVTVRLTEVEAYDGANDPGSHAFRGRTVRNAVMFGPAGRLYVYRHMGLHHCANVVTGSTGEAAAVLLRAGEVVAGSRVARQRRLRGGVVRTDRDLARGPARLAVALGLDLAMADADLLDPDSPVRLTVDGAAVSGAAVSGAAVSGPGGSGTTRPLARGPRVGVAGPGGEASAFPWRFWLPDEPTVSSYRPGAPPRRNDAPERVTGTAH